jgi:two-component system, chemotaxis family, protein-glutamate methylesterase/glutaminase
MPIRVLVVDDSAFMRRIIGEAINEQPDMDLVGTATGGLDALVKVEKLQPDVVTLDVEMPEMDGLTALRHLMARYPRPVVMVSNVTQQGAITTVRALAIGAVDFVAKPSGSISLDFARVREDLVRKIRIAATARVSASPAPLPVYAPKPISLPGAIDRLVVIGSSTGGPKALSVLVPALPNDGRTAYLVVQHMPAGFTKSLAERLDSLSQVTVREAAAGDRLSPGVALVAPGDVHLRVGAAWSVELNDGPRIHGVRPSLDVALESAARAFGPRCVAVVLTGMGQDGATGAEAVRKAGGYVLAEAESTCVVWGMPRAVVERGMANQVVPLDDMAAAVTTAIGSRRPAVRA